MKQVVASATVDPNFEPMANTPLAARDSTEDTATRESDVRSQ